MSDGASSSSSTAGLNFGGETVAAHVPGADPADGLWTILWRDSGIGAAMGADCGRIRRANRAGSAILGVPEAQTDWTHAPRLDAEGTSRLAAACALSVASRTHQALDLHVSDRWVRFTVLPAVREGSGSPMLMVPLATAVGGSGPVVQSIAPEPAVDSAVLARLNDRERMVLRLIAAGLTSQEIGKRMTRSPKTIEYYRARLSEKLGVSNRIQLVRLAFAHGLKPPETE